MTAEVNGLRDTDCRLLQRELRSVFCGSQEYPNILHEIGRLREVTFREVGEGTNESIDLDKFDQYYHHLFLWDEDAKKIAGAYRMGLGSEIYPKYGIEDFTSTSF
jgi:hypothetical protein